MNKMFLAALAAAALTTAARADSDAMAAWQSGMSGGLNLAATIKASAAQTFRGTGSVSGATNMFPCPIGPYGPTNGDTSGSAQVSGDIAVTSDDGKSHGTIHVTGTVWLDAFCSNGFPDMPSGVGEVTGTGVVYGPNGKALGQIKVSGSATVSGGFGSSVQGTVTVKGSL